MKRFWLGLGILAAVLCLSLALGVLLSRQHEALSLQMSRAARQALNGNWTEAVRLSEEASRQWQRHRHFTAALTDHEPLEELDRMFAQLKVYERQTMTAEYAALCTLLSRQAEAMGEVGRLAWWNFW